MWIAVRIRVEMKNVTLKDESSVQFNTCLQKSTQNCEYETFAIATTYTYIKLVEGPIGYFLTTMFSIGKLIHENLFFFMGTEKSASAGRFSSLTYGNYFPQPAETSGPRMVWSLASCCSARARLSLARFRKQVWIPMSPRPGGTFGQYSAGYHVKRFMLSLVNS